MVWLLFADAEARAQPAARVPGRGRRPRRSTGSSAGSLALLCAVTVVGDRGALVARVRGRAAARCCRASRARFALLLLRRAARQRPDLRHALADAAVVAACSLVDGAGGVPGRAAALAPGARRAGRAVPRARAPRGAPTCRRRCARDARRPRAASSPTGCPSTAPTRTPTGGAVALPAAGRRPRRRPGRARRAPQSPRSSTTPRSTRTPSWSRPSPPRPAIALENEHLHAESAGAARRAARPRASGSSRPATPSAGGSSATSTTARSSGSSRSRCSCGCCRTGSATTRRPRSS